MKKLLFITGLILCTSTIYAQKEALTWYFGNRARLNFHAGGNFPQPFFGSAMIARQGCISMSDKIYGQPIFYSNGENVWHSGDAPMPNGAGINGSALSLQPGISFPVPGTTSQYYLFTTGNALNKGAYYSVIDMSLNSGIGDIVPDKKNIRIPGIDSCQRVIMATRHANNSWYWVIFRSVGERNQLYAYKVTEKGVSSVPVKSECFTSHGTNDYAMSKFSPTGDLYVYTSDNWTTEQKKTYELYTFNSVTGVFTQTLMFKGLPDKPEIYDLQHRSNGIEFSPDGKYLYTTVMALDPGPPQTPKQAVNQFDMSKTGDYDIFMDGMRNLHQKDIIDQYCGMQLARDGRIYIAQEENKNNKVLSRIFYPNKYNTDCDFRDSEVPLSGMMESTFGLPTYVPSILGRFDWTNICLPDTTQFKSTFHPQPISVEWDFGDGSPVVTGFNPKHKFQNPGVYTVKATATYPREEIEVFAKKVFISSKPVINLGQDISVCPGDSAVLDVGLVPQSVLTWSTGDTLPSITVPVGEYRLLAENKFYGCTSRDTINVIEYIAPTVDNSNLYIFPTTCTGNTGYMSGITINGTGPFTYAWKDGAGNTVSTVLNPSAIGQGTYVLNVTDGHGCPWSYGTPTEPYTVISIDDDFLTEVKPFATVCGQDNGSIKFTPIPLMRGLLDYEISGPVTRPWQSDTLFKDLPSGNYQVRARVKQNLTCINQDWGPLVVGDDPRPPLVQANISQTPELDNNVDGTLTIDYLGADYTYVIIDSLGFRREQFDNPVFTGLMSGPYQCFAYTLTNCSSDTIYPFYVEQIYSTLLTGKLKGAPPVCKGRPTYADVKVHNFEGIVDFTVTLDYDRSKLVCLPDYSNLHPSLGSVNMNVNTTTGRVVIDWSSPTPLTLTDTITLLRLDFNTTNPGTAPIDWDISLTQFNEGPGYHLLVSGVTPDQVIIYDNPEVLAGDKEVCLHDPVTINSSTTPAGSYTYVWLKPDGFTSTSSEINIATADSSHAGQYRLIVTDSRTCRDTTTMNLVVHALPGNAFASDSLYFDLPDTLAAAPGYADYLWNTGDLSQWIMIQDTGYYSVVITDINGCKSESLVFANSKDQKKFFYDVPNAFTPNHDGLNDVFRPYTDHELITKFRLQIFDTWGQLVYQTNDSSKGWDGTINGLPAMPGPYGWSIVYSNYHKFNVKGKGVVWVIK